MVFLSSFCAPASIDFGHIDFVLYICSPVSLFLCVRKTLAITFDCNRAFIFQMFIPYGKTFSLVPMSRSSIKVKVKYQGHTFQKGAITGTLICVLA